MTRGFSYWLSIGLVLAASRAGAMPRGALERGSGGLFSGPAATPLPSGSSLWFALGGGITRGDARRGWEVFLALGVPLDRIAAPPRPAAFAQSSAALAEPALSEDAQKPSDPKPKKPEPAPHAPQETQSPPGPVPPPAPRTPAPPAQQTQAVPASAPASRRLTPALARGAVRHALAEAGFPARRGRLSNLATRARASAALPELRLRALRSNGQTLRLTPTLSDPYQYTEGGTNELLLEARATWRFDRLVFADEEVGIERLESERHAAERKLVEHVLNELLLWQRGQARAANEELESEERAAGELEALAALVELDVLTDGWFCRAIGESEPVLAAATGEPAEAGVDSASHAR